MSEKRVIVCDGCGDVCGDVISESKDRYKLNEIKLRTIDKIWDGAHESEYWYEEFDFCKQCATDIKETLENIEEQLKSKRNKNKLKKIHDQAAINELSAYKTRLIERITNETELFFPDEWINKLDLRQSVFALERFCSLNGLHITDDVKNELNEELINSIMKNVNGGNSHRMSMGGTLMSSNNENETFQKVTTLMKNIYKLPEFAPLDEGNTFDCPFCGQELELIVDAGSTYIIDGQHVLMQRENDEPHLFKCTEIDIEISIDALGYISYRGNGKHKTFECFDVNVELSYEEPLFKPLFKDE